MSSLETPTGLGSKNSIRLSPSKVRNRGSGELVEFCAESLQGSKHYVRQEPAQDPCGHDLLAPLAPPPSRSTSPFLRVEASAVSAGGISLCPPCPSPQLDDLAAVSSGSSYAGSHGDSQPGSAASHTSNGSIARAFPLEKPTDALGEEGAHGAANPFGAPLPPEQQQQASGASAEPEVECLPVVALLPLVHYATAPLTRSGVLGSFGAEGPFGAPSLGPRGTAPPREAAKLAVGMLASEEQQRKGGLGGGALQQLELPEGEAMIGASRSIVDETDFVMPVSLCLTPIRTRANTEAQEPADTTPVAYVDSLAAPQESSFPKVLPAVRSAIQIFATSTSSTRIAPSPGAYNPYDRTAIGGGGGYGGGRSYGFNYGCPPSGPPTSSSSSTCWASHQHHAKQESRSAAPTVPAPKVPTLRGLAAEQGWWGRPAPAAAPESRGSTPGPQQVEDDEVEHIVMVPGGFRRGAQQQHEEEEVEHIVMVPGMRRRTPARPLFQSAAQPSTAAAEKQCCVAVSPAAAGDEAVAVAREDASAADASNSMPPIETAAVEPAKGCPGGSNANNMLLKQIVKGVLVAGVVLAAAATSKA